MIVIDLETVWGDTLANSILSIGAVDFSNPSKPVLHGVQDAREFQLHEGSTGGERV